MKRSGPRVVIVGGGFGGLYAATYLARSELRDQGVRVTLVDRDNTFTFTPLLAEVAAGTLGREHVTTPYRVLGRKYGFDVVRDSVRAVNFDLGVVRTERTSLPYDYLVLAMGAEPQYFGNDALREASLPLTKVDDAIAIRDRVINALEDTVLTPEPVDRVRRTTFVVAGAGPAGVEVASEIHTLSNDVLRPYYPGVDEARVILADGGDRILRGWDEELAAEGLQRLRDRGIEVLLETRIQGFEEGIVQISTSNGLDEIPAGTLIWTAGMTPSGLTRELDVATDRGAIEVEPTLRVKGHENVFAVGDVAILEDPRVGEPYPAVAPIAISMGVRAAGNIESLVLGRDLEEYRAHHAGKIVSLGSGVALVDLLGYRITGRLAWWIYRSAYLMKLVGTKNKLQVGFTLALNRWFEPDIGSSRSSVAHDPSHTSVG